ncbi:hypothetical protein D9615_005684 [Tricholomella constricta]|uniref:Uncharacterized protein n=1 Tax=Tricholomella constricta TaxID=117010 RepID=A0A8H5HAM7_9AGAR|nr:hypothetical protein D9615_005684 [Tricholomella constricta]
MHATSAVALVVVAFSAASSLAIPMAPDSEGLEARSIYRRADKPAVNQKDKAAASFATKDATIAGKDAAATDPTKASSHAKGSGTTTTITVTVTPRCKNGAQQRKGSNSHHGSQKSDKVTPDANGKKAAPAQPILPRAAGASPTQTSTSKENSAASAPTLAPTGDHNGGHQHKNGRKKGGSKFRNAAVGDVLTTITRVGQDHNTTVRKYVKGTNTNCPEPTSSPDAKGSHRSGKVTGPTHKDGTAADSVNAKANANTNKLVARAVHILERYFSELDQLD